MDAVLLYVLTAGAILWAWSRWVQRISPAAAIALLLMPVVVTGRALLTGRVYSAIDQPFLAEPLKTYAAAFGITGYNGWLSDVYTTVIPWQQAVRAAWHSGAWPLLNPFMFCGHILAASYQSAPYDPFNILGLLIPLPAFFTYSATVTFFLAAFSAFVFARTIGLREEAALVAAAAFMFCADLVVLVGWAMARAWTYLPLVLTGVRLVVHRPSVRSAVILTIAFVLLILAGHPETILHVAAFAAVYGLFELDVLRRHPVRAIAFAAASGLIALLLTAFALLPLFEAAPQTRDYLTRYGIYRETTWPAMPDMVKRTVASSFLPDWGGRPWHKTDTAAYTINNWRVGAVACALALAALIWAARRRETWFFLVMAIVCAWAGANALPVARILHAIPLFDVTLNERLSFAAAFSIALLAAIAADAWPERWRLRLTGALICIGVPAVLLAFMRDRLMIAEIAPLAIIVILLALRTPARIAVPIVLGLVLLQRAVVDGGVYPSLPRKAFYPKVPLIRAIPQSDREPYRVAGVTFNLIPNGATMYGLEDPRGYDAMTFERLAETFPLWSTPQPASFNVIGDPSPPFLSFLNVRWFLQGQKLIENRDAMPRAFVPQHIHFTPNALPAMLTSTDFRTQAWIEVPEQQSTDFDNARGTVTTTRIPNGIDLDVNMAGDGWVVISETAWKGWRAYVDRRRVEWRFANQAFLGVFVPRGRHHVVLRYLPKSFTRGRAISSITLAVLIVAAIVQRRRGATGGTAPRSSPSAG